MNTFIALGIPNSAAAVLKHTVGAYAGKLATAVPEEKWHVTLLFLGDASISSETLQTLQEPLHTAYMPAVTVLSLGACLPAGRQASLSQLWAHIHETPAIVQLRQLITDRLTQCSILIPMQELSQEFTPHINLGTIEKTNGNIGIADTPAKITFAVREALVLKSNPEEPSSPYERIATIPLVP